MIHFPCKNANTNTTPNTQGDFHILKTNRPTFFLKILKLLSRLKRKSFEMDPIIQELQYKVLRLNKIYLSSSLKINILSFLGIRLNVIKFYHRRKKYIFIEPFKCGNMVI